MDNENYDWLRILCVDDSSETRKAFKETLALLFKNVAVASDGAEGLSLYEKTNPHIVISDISMPLMSGLEMTKRIKSKSPQTIVILTSAYNESSHLHEVIQCGADGFINKPVKLKKLIDKIKDHANKIYQQESYLYTKKLLEEYKDLVDEFLIVSKTTIDGTIIYVNEAFCKISGYTKEELIGKTHRMLKHQDTPRELFEAMWNTIKSGNTWKGVIKNRTKDDGYYVVEAVVKPILGINGQITEFISLRKDITEQEKYREFLQKQLGSKEKSLKESQKELSYRLGNMAELRSKETGQHAKRVANFVAILAKATGFPEDQAKNNQSRVSLGQISDCVFSTSSSKLNESMQQQIKEEALKYKEQEQMMLQQSRLIAMGEMIGNIAHHWRQPLNALSLNIQKLSIAQEYGKLTPEFLDNTIEESNSLIQRISDTIDDFRNFFKIDKEKKSFFVYESVENVMMILDGAFKKEGIHVALNIQKKEQLMGYPNEFQQVLLAILVNARDAILTNNESGGAVKIYDYEASGAQCLCIEDNGGGIKNEILPLIFEPYFTTKNGSGAGIGLYMSKRIIESSIGGSIFAENIDGGARFCITFPMKK